MASAKIIAYFMHEHEDALISSNIAAERRTDSFVIGDADEEQRLRLENQGIIFQVLSPPEPSVEIVDTPGIGGFSMNKFSGNFMNTISATALEIFNEQAAAGFPAFYKFSTLGPLLEEDKLQLLQSGIALTEFIPPDLYVVRIDDQEQYDKLTLMDFTRQITFYSSNDTGVLTTLKVDDAMPVEVKGHDIVTYDILLHEEEKLDEFTGWLKSKNILISGSAGRKVRIYLMYDSPLVRTVAANPLVRFMNEYVIPKLHNDAAAAIIGSDVYGSTPPGPLMSYQGEGELIGIADTGIDVHHPDFAGQITGTKDYGRAGNVTDPAGHGTHVAGTIAGKGTASSGKIKGIAPKAKLYFQSLLNASDGLSLPLQLADLFDDAYKKGARIHNNSWGASTESKYTVNSIEVDDFVYKNKDMLLVFSAGNDGNAIRSPNVLPGHVDFLTIGSPASAKNVLTVGASRSTRTTVGFASMTYNAVWPRSFPHPPYYTVETVSGNSNCLAGFSSRGPCDDDRIKPDVVAPGTDIVSTKASTAPLSNFWGSYPGNPQYALMGGTSMSAPVVTGFAALVREYYVKNRQIKPSAALVKATIINGCRKLTGVDAVLKFSDLPNFNQGFGLVNAGTTIPTPSNDFFLFFVDNYQSPAAQLQQTGQRLRLKFKVNTPGCWLRVCLAYTDFPARAIQNNLNLMMDCATKKWVGNESGPSLLKQLDSKNNVEVIAIADAPVGTYTLQVVASNLIKGPQDFALVITSSDNTISPPFNF